ncbi:isochorismatase family protein [Nocardia jinanensis]|uniref:N-carbamoylsarcosine amidase n=1 Tax=Nocardia jinanensis TaxID=382504 RepID=A0A917VVA2_9NOCA|nr:isochorismatase family protein [Nocardia jinanensis]GGL17414.1 N-carbamoylsarcosine amidase [Nocardia jinanensis]
MTGTPLLGTTLAEDYAHAGFGGHLEPGVRPALLVVDPARAYTEPDSPLYAAVGDAVAAMLEFREQAATAGIPIYLTRVRYDHADGVLGGLFFRKVPGLACFTEGNPLAEFVDGFAPRRGETVVTKHYPSAFAGTSLAASLTTRGIDTVLIVGLSTSGCIRATALDALQNGFVPIVVRECVGDRHPDPHESNLRDIAAKIGEVYSLTEAHAYLTSLAGEGTIRST